MTTDMQSKDNPAPSFANLKLHDEDPMCPECGSICQLKSRSGLWECCSYTISVHHWDIIRLHAATAKNIFLGEGISTVIFSQVPVDVDSAVSCSHLLPVIVNQSNESAKSEGIQPLLKITEISDEACENCLLPFGIGIEPEGCSISESLSHLTATIRHSIKQAFISESVSATLDFKYITDPDGA
jgi:hypothetical protein